MLLSEAERIFNLSQPYTLKDVQKTYKRLSLMHHPDRGGSPEKMIEINEAYKVLRTGQNTRQKVQQEVRQDEKKKETDFDDYEAFKQQFYEEVRQQAKEEKQEAKTQETKKGTQKKETKQNEVRLTGIWEVLSTLPYGVIQFILVNIIYLVFFDGIDVLSAPFVVLMTLQISSFFVGKLYRKFFKMIGMRKTSAQFG